MKFNIKPSDARYIIDEEKKIVICIIEKTQYLFTDFVDSNFTLKSTCDGSFWEGGKLYSKLIMPNKFVGVARCSEEDEWSEEVGKLIAFSRAKDNVNKSFFKRANTYVNYIDKQLDYAADIINKLGVKLSINTNHRHNLIDSLLGE